MSKHLYFYSDALEWGGQEILAARIANILADKYQVHFFFSSEKFKTALNSSVEKISLPYHSQNPFPIVRDRISKKHKKTEQIFRDYGAGSDNFKKLIICPGNIERCIPAITAATKLKLQIISYYPMALTQKESKATLGSLRDRLALRIYPKITKWIVNTPYQEQLLRRFIDIDTEVFQLPNPLTFKENDVPKKPREIKRILNIGRIYFGQKGQEIIPEISKRLPSNSAIQFEVIGHGPDAEALRNKITQEHLEKQITTIDWISPNEIQKKFREQADALLVTSKFESGPMVLFEALQCGVPVIAANEDYIKAYRLPGWMTFEPGNANDAVKKLNNLPKDWNLEEFESTRKALFCGRTSGEFQQRVLDIFDALE